MKDQNKKLVLFFASTVLLGLSGVPIDQAIARPLNHTGTYTEAISQKLVVAGELVAAPQVESSSMVVSAQPAPAAVAVAAPTGTTQATIDSIPDVAPIAKLSITKEESISAKRYAIAADQLDYFKKLVPYQLASPKHFDASEMQGFKHSPSGAVLKPAIWNPSAFAMNQKSESFETSRAGIGAIDLKLKLEAPIQLAKVVPLTDDEFRFLSALLLFQQGQKCATASPIFHKLSHSKEFQAESDYYLSQCALTLGLKGDYFDRVSRVLNSEDVYYARKVLETLPTDVPAQWIDRVGSALFKATQNKKIMEWPENSLVPSSLYFVLADFGLQTDRIKTAASYSRMVKDSHPKYSDAQFIAGISDYQMGARTRAIETLNGLLGQLEKSNASIDLKSLTALNLARLQFQEKHDKESREAYLKIAKDHPLWLTALTEMGWSQLQGGDYEGAIGNMYSIHSPYFQSVFKPESHVIQTIGYLNLCQYADAYRSLTSLEKQYRPYLEKILEYSNAHKAPTYLTVKSFVSTQKSNQDYDGLPSQVVREMARQKDFIILQKSLNQQLDEKEIYGRLDQEIETGLQAAQKQVIATRKQMTSLKQEIALADGKRDKVRAAGLRKQLEGEIEKLNLQFFQIDLYNEAKLSLADFKKEVVIGAEKRIAGSRDRIEKVLNVRLEKMKDELVRILDNNELLRYEVFAGSGENLRYQIAGGQKGNRVPANVLPKSKSLQWDFDGEYWEDEIGNYRSTLKNNCPATAKQQTASLDPAGGAH